MVGPEAQQFSKLLFVRKYHLAILEFVAARNGATFTLAEMVRTLGVRSSSSLQTSVDALMDAGLIRQAPAGEDPDERVQLLVAAGSLLWSVIWDLTQRRKAYEASGVVGVEVDQPIQQQLFPT